MSAESAIKVDESLNLVSVDFLPAIDKTSTKTPLVLIHGWGNSSRCWQPLLKELDEDRDLYLVDLPGCGSNICTSIFSAEELLVDLELSLPESCYVLGWSLGGMLATQLVLLGSPKVRGLITLATNLSFVSQESWPWALDQATWNKFLKGFRDNPAITYKKFLALQALHDPNRKQVLKQLEVLNPKPTREQHSNWLCLLEILQELDGRELKNISFCPALHLFAENDSLVPNSVAAEIDGAPFQRVKVIGDCGHAMHLSKPACLVDEISGFLQLQDERLNRLEQKKRIANAFSSAAKEYDSAAKLQQKIAENLVGLRGFLDSKQSPSYNSTVLDLGCGTGFVSDLLDPSLSEGCSYHLLDLSQSMLDQAARKSNLKAENIHYLLADMDHLPLAPASMDFVFSSMSMQWSVDPEKLLARIYECLKPGGYFLFATVGEGTLQELAQSWREVDDFVHVNSFVNFKDLKQMLQKQKFTCEDSRRELHVQCFDDVLKIMKSLKVVGAHTVNTVSKHGLTSRARLFALQEAYEKFRRKNDAMLPVSWEVYYFVLRK